MVSVRLFFAICTFILTRTQKHPSPAHPPLACHIFNILSPWVVFINFHWIRISNLPKKKSVCEISFTTYLFAEIYSKNKSGLFCFVFYHTTAVLTFLHHSVRPYHRSSRCDCVNFDGTSSSLTAGTIPRESNPKSLDIVKGSTPVFILDFFLVIGANESRTKDCESRPEVSEQWWHPWSP